MKLCIKKIFGLLEAPKTVYSIGKILYRILGIQEDHEKLNLAPYSRILVVRLDVIGDIVMMSPFLRELRKNNPNAEITLVVDPVVHNLVEYCPYVNEILTYSWQGNCYLAPLQRMWRSLKLAKKYFWPKRIDAALLPRWNVDIYTGTYLAYLSGAIRRVGFVDRVNSRKRIDNVGCPNFLTHSLDSREPKHEVQRNLELLQFSGGVIHDEKLELWITESDKSFATAIIGGLSHLPQRIIIAFGVGASAGHRQWPATRFLELGSWLIQEYSAVLIVLGGKEDNLTCAYLQERLGVPVIDMTGKTTLRQTSALLGHCHLFVGNDSGPMHLAAAAGVPVIEISSFPIEGSPIHDQSPYRFGPWNVTHCILQPERTFPPCKESCDAAVAHCILSVSVQQVKESIKSLLPR